MELIRKVGLGSGSAIKIDCVKEAFGPFVEVIPVVETPSGVPPQPIGRDQTKKGARNRATYAMQKRPSCDAWIGIENGMWPVDEDGGKMEDAAYVVMLVRKIDDLEARTSGASKTNNAVTTEQVTEVVVLSDAIAIPPDSEKPFEGGPNGEWSVLKDPHAVLTDGKKPRKAFLLEAVKRLDVPRIPCKKKSFKKL